MIAHRVWNAAFVAGLALLSGCAVTQSQLEAKLNQQTTEMRSYVDQKVSASESATHKDLAEVRADLEAIRARADAVLKEMQSQQSDIRQNRETLRNMLEEQSQALEQQKRTADALLERFEPGSVGEHADALAVEDAMTKRPMADRQASRRIA